MISTEYKLDCSTETDHFKIRYTKADLSCIDEVVRVLDSQYIEITELLNRKLDEKLEVEIHSVHQELLNALGFPNGPKWIRGGVGDNKILIASPLNPPPKSTYENVLKTAVHEVVHKIVALISCNIPRWLDEGTASFIAKDNREAWIKETVSDGVRSNTLPSFDCLDTGNDFEEFFNRDGYQYSYTIVEFIVDKYGYDKLVGFIKEPDNVSNLMGCTLQELEHLWIKYIQRNYSTL